MSFPDLSTELSALGLLFRTAGTQAEALRMIAVTAARVVPGAAEASVTLWQDNGPYTLASTSDAVLMIDQAQYDTMSGPCVEAARTGRVYTVDDTATDVRWPEFGSAADRQGMRSSLSVPLRLGSHLVGSLNIYGLSPFDQGALDVADRVAGISAVMSSAAFALDRARAHAVGLESALTSRTTIDRAVGIVMAQQRLGQDAAFATLVKLSQDSNRKLRDLATALVADHDSRYPAPTTEG